MSRKYDVIENHRNAPRVEMEIPTLEQLATLRDGLKNFYGIGKVCDLTGWDEHRVLDQIATLGKWLVDSNGAIEVNIKTFDQLPKGVLFQTAAQVAGPKTLGKGRGAKAAAEKAKIKLAKRDVYLPKGFEPGRLSRDVSRALSAIVIYDPADATLARFIARIYPSVHQASITFSILAGVWKFSEAGRLDGISRVAPKSPTFMNLVVGAFDLLDLAIDDAVAGIDDLCALGSAIDQSNIIIDLNDVSKACTKARWISEGEISRIESRIELAKKHGSTTSLMNELCYFKSRVDANPKKYHIGDICELSSIQLRRIAEAAGIRVLGTDRVGESEIRSRLKFMGMNMDLDRLIHAGMQADQIGKLDLFYEAMQSRVEGDVGWPKQLADIFTDDQDTEEI